MSHRGRSRLVVLATALTIAALVPCGRAAAADKKPGEAPGPTPAPAGPPPDFNPSSAPPADTSLFAGQLSRKFKINKDNPEGSVPNDKLKNENPLEFGYFLQDLITLAELARRQKDYVGAVKYYRAVVVAAPDNAAGWSKLCEAYSLFGDPVKAAGTCRQAIERPGAEVNDFKRYVENTLKQEPLSAEQLTSINAVLEHLDKTPGGALAGSQLRCELGVSLKDVKMLEGCTAKLAELAPDDLGTVVFQWDLAVRKGQGAQAARLLKRAQQLGLPKDNIERMRKFTPSGGWKVWAAGGVALLLAGLAFARWTARRRRGGSLIQQSAS